MTHYPLKLINIQIRMNIDEEIDDFQFLLSDDLNSCFFMSLNSHSDFHIWGLTIFLVLPYPTEEF